MKNRVVILGAGTAGLWTALTLAETQPDLDVTLVEMKDSPGGITGSFDYRGITFDYGSHRLHPATPPPILERISGMLGGDLLKRPRNGRILLEGRFISFPLRPADLLLSLPPSFSLGFLMDTLISPFRRRGDGTTFEDTLIGGLGRTISRRFYFPYARKLWGLPPGELSPVQARKRVAAGSISRMLGKVLSSTFRPGGSGNIFYYPRKGFGQIAERTAEEAEKLGAVFHYGSPAVSVKIPAEDCSGAVTLDSRMEIKADFILSTIPVSSLTDMIHPAVPQYVAEAAAGLSFRSMIFCFLEVMGERYTKYDAHYFPGEGTIFSRLSEPGNYSMSDDTPGRTGLCFEIPCSSGDGIWGMDAVEVLEKVLSDLEGTGLPVPGVLSHRVARRDNIYPVYDLGFQQNLSKVEEYLDGAGNIVTLGRQGLFVHDNVHHAIEMGIAAGKCLNSDLAWDREEWARYRDIFASHVVAD
jgi:protoporphyrinogen oxidase